LALSFPSELFKTERFDVSMHIYANEKWIELYYAALIERRQTRIPARVQAARFEIADRLGRLEGITES